MVTVRISYNAVSEYSADRLARLLRYLKQTGAIYGQTEDGGYVMVDTAGALVKDLYPLAELNRMPTDERGYLLANANNLIEQLDEYYVLITGKATGLKKISAGGCRG